MDPPTPVAVMELIKCNCCKSHCESKCSCKQHNLYCTEMCKCESDENMCENTIDNHMETDFEIENNDFLNDV